MKRLIFSEQTAVYAWALASFVGATTALIQLGMVAVVVGMAPMLDFSGLNWPAAHAKQLVVVSGIVVALVGIAKVVCSLYEADREDAKEVTMKQEAQTSSANVTPRLFTIRIRPFRPGHGQPLAWLRARAIGVVIRCLVLMGFRVLVVGVARCGKSYLLERSFPGKVIDGGAAVRGGKAHSTPFDFAKVPHGMFAIEEAQCLNQDDLMASLESLNHRRFAISIQRLQDVSRLGLDVLFDGRRTVMFHLGTQAQWARP